MQLLLTLKDRNNGETFTREMGALTPCNSKSQMTRQAQDWISCRGNDQHSTAKHKADLVLVDVDQLHRCKHGVS